MREVVALTEALADDPALPYRLSATVAGFFVVERMQQDTPALEKERS